LGVYYSEKIKMKMLRGVTKGLPQTGLQGGAGVGVFYLHRMLASKVAFLQNNPLAAPIGFIVLGHVLKKSAKLGTIGAALCGAGGYAGAQVFEVRKSMQTQAAPPAQTSGFDEDYDTGAVMEPADIGMLMQPGNIGDLGEGPASAYEDTGALYSDAYSL
jgi:hypothetical protein